MEWISFKDKTPEQKNGSPSELFLAYDSNNKQIRIGYMHQGKVNIQCSYCSEEANWTHWAKMPNPPKE